MEYLYGVPPLSNLQAEKVKDYSSLDLEMSLEAKEKHHSSRSCTGHYACRSHWISIDLTHGHGHSHFHLQGAKGHCHFVSSENGMSTIFCAADRGLQWKCESLTLQTN
jgi:hypothetical protein